MKISEILTKTQDELKYFLRSYLNENGYANKVISTDDYVFGIGRIPILLVAHLDTVHKSLPKEIFFDKDKKVLWSPQGIRWR